MAILSIKYITILTNIDNNQQPANRPVNKDQKKNSYSRQKKPGDLKKFSTFQTVATGASLRIGLTPLSLSNF